MNSRAVQADVAPPEMAGGSSADELEDRLLALGHRITAPRRQLLQRMRQLGHRFDLETLQAATPGASRSTVFRTLRLLIENGLVHRVTLPDGSSAYRLAATAMPHHHATCVDCGAIQPIEHERLEQILEGIAASLGYQLTAHRFDIFGHCGACD